MKIIAISRNNRRETVNSWHIPNDNIHNAKTIFPKWVPQSPLSQSRPVLPMADPHFHTVQCAHLAHCKLSICDWSVFKKHPPQKLQLQWGKKQTNKNWVVLTSCLPSLRFSWGRRAEEWAEINVLLLIMWKTIFSDRLELTRMIHSGQQFPSELSLNSVFSRQLVRYSSYCCSVLTGAPRFKCLSTSPVSASRPSPSSTLPTPPAYYRKHDVTPTLVLHVPMRITLLIMQTETWQKMAVQWRDNV